MTGAMNGKERMRAVLGGKVTHAVPVTPHWWGLYKFQHAGMIHGYDREDAAWRVTGEELHRVDARFLDSFDPDMAHLTGGTPNNLDERKHREAAAIRASGELLASKALIDEYAALLWRGADEIVAGEEFSHVQMAAQAYGNRHFVAVNEGLTTGAYFNEHCHVGFEAGLIGMLEEPENSAYLLSRVYEQVLERVKALARLGCDGYISSETHCSSDILSPETYRELIWPSQRRFFGGVKALGLSPIAYFTGEIRAILPEVLSCGIDALMVEEPIKRIDLAMPELLALADNRVAVFGNLDTVGVLLKGSVRDVERETRAFLRAAEGKRFIMANGCPVAFDTPPENIRAMLWTARDYEREQA